MNKLNDFMNILSGNFDNSEQFKTFQENGNLDYPFSQHVNTVCNHKIENLPKDFDGYFLVEESYYTIKGKTHSSSHLFLFTQETDTVLLTSYDLPSSFNKSNFTYESIDKLNYNELKESKKFTPAVYKLINGVWEGGSESMFSPTLKFKLFEKFSNEMLEVSEIMEVNGKRTFGYDDPIIYKRI